jgi:anti-sigma B factor antagonist
VVATETDVQPFHLESILAGDDCAVLQVTGEVDVYTAPELRERVVQLLADGAVHIIVDLRDVRFLDSTGLGTLVGALRRVRTQDGSLMLVTSTRRILEIFNLTGLINAFAIYPSIPEAMAASEPWQAAVASEGSGAEEWCRKHGLALRPRLRAAPCS